MSFSHLVLPFFLPSLWVICNLIQTFVITDMAALSLTEHEHEGDQDTLGPLPPQQQAIPWMTGGPPAYGYHQMPSYPPPMPTDPKNVAYAHSFYSGTSAHSGSQSPHSGSGSSKRGSERDRQGDDHRSSGSSSDRSGSSKGKGSCQSVRSEVTAPPLVPAAPRPLDQVPESVASSRNSFRMAMTNPCEYFVDVM